ncbi:hypothetical protein PFICI_04758 [Pestalotiopsis fici W106-1]|uniref:Zn(2)-C6 fungal-type domain-containing protein n=1 Tax=Pestalotiopsis fici (strain W106-1 / CGMCC3.15140) TaxID=1229662 RepID=W3XBT0_PESFW|nr:uncharacterized protein PFICI_04758 [Pestalotiopsis fici W106-1]ETS82882.1 hypothetical protein PFICI_04758 [Pestalotiopsis fici W106-1]
MAHQQDRCLSGTHTSAAVSRLEYLKGLSKRFSSPTPELIEDVRLNPYLREYNPDVAWEFLSRAPVVVQWRWRMVFLDPNDPVCDRCAIFLRRGRVGRSADWPDFCRGSSGQGTCDTAGDGECGECDGRNCTTLALPANNWAVREYVRGRSWHWYEGVGKVACDECRQHGEVETNCEVWQDDGCSNCKKNGRKCRVRGLPHGSCQERLNRRSGHENLISEPFVDPHDVGTDLVHLYAVSSGGAEAPGEPPLERLTEATRDPKLPAPTGARYFASLAQAQEALLKGGAVRTTKGDDAPPPTKRADAALRCERCKRLGVECKKGSRAKSCAKCNSAGVRCRFDPTAHLKAPQVTHVMKAEWDLDVRAPNGRWLREDEIKERSKSAEEKAKEQEELKRLEAEKAAAEKAAAEKAAAEKAAAEKTAAEKAAAEKAAAEKAAAEKAAAKKAEAMDQSEHEDSDVEMTDVWEDTDETDETEREWFDELEWFSDMHWRAEEEISARIKKWKGHNQSLIKKLHRDVANFDRYFEKNEMLKIRFHKFLAARWEDPSRDGLDIDLRPASSSYGKFRDEIRDLYSIKADPELGQCIDLLRHVAAVCEYMQWLQEEKRRSEEENEGEGEQRQDEEEEEDDDDDEEEEEDPRLEHLKGTLEYFMLKRRHFRIAAGITTRSKVCRAFLQETKWDYEYSLWFFETPVCLIEMDDTLRRWIFGLQAYMEHVKAEEHIYYRQWWGEAVSVVTIQMFVQHKFAEDDKARTRIEAKALKVISTLEETMKKMDPQNPEPVTPAEIESWGKAQAELDKLNAKLEEMAKMAPWRVMWEEANAEWKVQMENMKLDKWMKKLVKELVKQGAIEKYF